MSDNHCIIRIAKIKNKASLTSAEKHNKRLYDVPNADPAKSNDNQNHIPNSATDNFDSLLKKYAIKPRKNAVLAIEVLCTFSPGMTSSIDLDKWVTSNIEFVQKRFGGRENIIAADLHLDETTPHIHFIVMPLVCKFDKRKKGKCTSLSAKHFVGGSAAAMSELQDQYGNAMRSFGLVRGKKRVIDSPQVKVTHSDVKEHYNVIHANKVEAKNIIKPISDRLKAVKSMSKFQVIKKVNALDDLKHTLDDSKLLTLLSDNKTLTKKAKKQNKRIKSLNTQLKEKDKKILQAERTVSDLEAKKSESQAEFDELKKQYEELNNKHDELLIECEKMEEQQAKLHNQVRHLKTQRERKGNTLAIND